MRRTTLTSLLLGAAIGLVATSVAANVAASADQVQPLEAGTAAPDGPLTNASGEATTLHDALGGKPTVLIYYRGGW